MSNLLNCYHHANCDDRLAVATCSECGKGLCAECADRLHSPTTDRILCVDCLNAELDVTVARASAAGKATMRELVMIGVGLVIGIILAVILANVLESWSFIAYFMPTLFACLGTIWQMRSGYGLLIGALIFIVLMLVSPIIFIWRVFVRIRDIIALKKFAACQTAYRNANDKFFQLARSMKSEKADPAKIRRELEIEYAAIRENNQAEYEKRVSEGVNARLAEHEAEMEEMRKAVNEIKEQQKGMEMATRGVDKAGKELGKKTTHDRESIEV